MDQINILAVLVAAASAFLLGGLWYSPVLFGKIWAREAGVGDEPKQGHAAVVFAVSFIFSIIAATVFALFLVGRNASVSVAVRDGLAIGVCWVATSFGINYQFANRTFKLFLIDGGYHVAQFTLYGAILGLWH